MAVGVMTSWNADPAGPAKQSPADDIGYLMAENRATLSDVIDGLVSLSGRLLVDLEWATGNAVEEILQRVAREHALE